MANTLITPETVAKLAYANLRNNAVMASLVSRYDGDFVGKVGDTVNVRKPAVFTAQSFSSAISVQNATEVAIPVVLDEILDVSIEVTAKELALDIESFNDRFMTDAIDALVKAVDKKILGLVTTGNLTTNVYGEIDTDAGAWKPVPALIAANKLLNVQGVPATNRFCVIGPETEAYWLSDPLFHQYDRRGDTDGLENASIGRKFGFDIYMSQNVTNAGGLGTGATDLNVAAHRSAFALATAPLDVPSDKEAAVFSGKDGISIRVVKGYDQTAKKTVMSLDILCGVKLMDEKRAVLISDADGS